MKLLQHFLELFQNLRDCCIIINIAAWFFRLLLDYRDCYRILEIYTDSLIVFLKYLYCCRILKIATQLLNCCRILKILKICDIAEKNNTLLIFLKIVAEILIFLHYILYCYKIFEIASDFWICCRICYIYQNNLIAAAFVN